jgi:hypothetical protein
MRWDVHWCLPPFTELTDQAKRDLLSSGLSQFARGVRDPDKPGRVSDEFAHAGAPIIVAPLGAVCVPPLPIPVAVPTSTDEIRDRLESEIEDTVTSLELARGEGDSGDEWLRTSDEHNLEFVLNPDAVAACEFLTRTANSAMPSFVSDRYRVTVSLRAPDKWNLGRLKLELAHEAGTSLRVPFDELASGFVLWVQLALLEAADELRRVRERLWIHRAIYPALEERPSGQGETPRSLCLGSPVSHSSIGSNSCARLQWSQADANTTFSPPRTPTRRESWRQGCSSRVLWSFCAP